LSKKVFSQLYLHSLISALNLDSNFQGAKLVSSLNLSTKINQALCLVFLYLSQGFPSQAISFIFDKVIESCSCKGDEGYLSQKYLITNI